MIIAAVILASLAVASEAQYAAPAPPPAAAYAPPPPAPAPAPVYAPPPPAPVYAAPAPAPVYAAPAPAPVYAAPAPVYAPPPAPVYAPPPAPAYGVPAAAAPAPIPNKEQTSLLSEFAPAPSPASAPAPAPAPTRGAAPAPEEVAIPPNTRVELHDNRGQYSHGFSDDKGTQVSEQGTLISTDNGWEYVIAKKGSYSYTSPEGLPITVEYIADENGFRATGTFIAKRR